MRNVDGAHGVGLKCGAYHYSYALTPADAIAEAEFCKQIISDSGVLLELPVWFDMEDADGFKHRHNFDFSRKNVTDICRAFLDAIKPFDCGISCRATCGNSPTTSSSAADLSTGAFLYFGR